MTLTLNIQKQYIILNSKIKKKHHFFNLINHFYIFNSVDIMSLI